MNNTTQLPQTEEKQIPTVELGGRLWELRFGHKAMKLFCQKARVTLATFDRAMEYYDNQILMIWCAMWTQDKAVTQEQLDDWLDELTLEDVFRLGGDMVAAAMPTAAEQQELKDAAESAEDPGEENPTGETTSPEA